MEPEARVDASGLPIRPLPDGSDVRKSTAAELTHVVEAVARSFYEDPIFRWIVPDDGRRPRQLKRGFALFARRVWFPQDETYTTDRLIGGAFWMPPGAWHLSLLKQLSMLPAMAVILRGELPRLLRLLNAIEARHPHERHYYLPVIGIGPEWQGRGFGSALLRPILERCDRARDEAPVDEPAQLVVPRRVGRVEHLPRALVAADAVDAEHVRLRRAEGVRVLEDADAVRVAGDRPEAGLAPLGVPVERLVVAEVPEDGVDLVGGVERRVGEVDPGEGGAGRCGGGSDGRLSAAYGLTGTRAVTRARSRLSSSSSVEACSRMKKWPPGYSRCPRYFGLRGIQDWNASGSSCRPSSRPP